MDEAWSCNPGRASLQHCAHLAQIGCHLLEDDILDPSWKRDEIEESLAEVHLVVEEVGQVLLELIHSFLGILLVLLDDEEVVDGQLGQLQLQRVLQSFAELLEIVVPLLDVPLLLAAVAGLEGELVLKVVLHANKLFGDYLKVYAGLLAGDDRAIEE